MSNNVTATEAVRPRQHALVLVARHIAREHGTMPIALVHHLVSTHLTGYAPTPPRLRLEGISAHERLCVKLRYGNIV